jgi:hypothetical protein
MSHDDPLDAIWVKTEVVEGVQRQLLAKIILPFASVDPEKGSVHFKEAAEELNTKLQVLLYLLCRLALASRPDPVYTATVLPREIEKATGLSGGTVRPKISQLQQERLIHKSGEGYFVMPENMKRIYGEFESVIPTSTSES